MRAVMYHYVKDGDQPLPDYYHLAVEDFRAQLDHIEAEYGFLTYEEFEKALAVDVNSAPEGALLTFDDGFRDHYEVVYPELRKRGLWGIFYVPTYPLTEHELLDVHKLHVLLGEGAPATLLDHIREIVDEEMVPHKKREEFRSTYEHQDDIDEVKLIKRTFNFYLAEEYRSTVVDELMHRLDVTVEWDDLYMTGDELREMHDDGMIIGPHTVTHPVLSKLPRDQQRTEIESSLRHLQQHIPDLRTRTFCYPYGYPLSFDEETLAVLSELDFDSAFIVDPEPITIADLCDSYALPRYDCNELPHGQSSGGIG